MAQVIEWPAPVGDACNVGGNNRTAETCGTSRPEINYPADPGTCTRNPTSANTVIFTIWGCEITCTYTPATGSSRASAKCECFIEACPEFGVPARQIVPAPKK